MGAPSSIQRAMSLVSSGSIGLTETSVKRLCGGISSARIRFNIKLSSGLPGMNAGPDFPPRNMASRSRRSSPPSF